MRTDTLYVMRRSTELALSGPVDVDIITSIPDPHAVMEDAVHSLEAIEEFMGVAAPIPNRQAIYWFKPQGTLTGQPETHIELSEFWAKQSQLRDQVGADVIASWTAGYYWNKRQPGWLDLGAVIFLATAAGGDLDIEAYKHHVPCAFAENISEFEAHTDRYYGEGDCSGGLGERLFRDLYDSMDHYSFRNALRSLYLHETGREVITECSRPSSSSFCPVREAFLSHVAGADRDAVERKLDMWWDGRPSAAIRIVFTWEDGKVVTETVRLQFILESHYHPERGGPQWYNWGLTRTRTGHFVGVLAPGTYLIKVSMIVSHPDWSVMTVGYYDGKSGVVCGVANAARVEWDAVSDLLLEIELPEESQFCFPRPP